MYVFAADMFIFPTNTAPQNHLHRKVRYKEDMPPLGLNFIKLGLNDVLYDPVSKTFYTPNTDSHAKIDDAGLQSGDEGDIISEKRYNDKHDEKGRFAEGSGSKHEKTKYSPSPQRNHGGIQVKPKTYAKLCGEFNTKYPGSRKGFQGTVFKGKYQYLATSDGEGGMIINRKIKL